MNKQTLTDSVKVILNLEWLGVRIEAIKDEPTDAIFATKTAYYYSVPESSTIELENKELNNRIKTSDGLKLLAKEQLTNMIIESCSAEYPDEEDFIQDLKDNMSDYFKFYAKVRKCEIWNSEMGNARLKELNEVIQLASQYSEI